VYVCGPTVYNYFHIGNARPFVVFDVLRRYLEFVGYEVTLVQNFTDIDDRMIRRANEEGVTVKELAQQYIAAYFEDAGKLGVKPATVHPRATEHIPEIVALIDKLVGAGVAYESDGDVYFDTKAFPRYGCLCGQNIDDLEAGARIDIDERKRHPMDFALWKAQKPGEPAWESPWGMGRPGWHIECSAMSMHYLGETFDIHCGGQDLIFPHHENEIAQSEAATGQPFARYWMHNGFLNIDNQKMSKSLNNFFTVRDILAEFDPEAVRLFLLSAQYRSPLNFSRDQIQQASATLARLYAARDQARFLMERAQSDVSEGDEEVLRRIDEARAMFLQAMDDDLNTADALGSLFELVRILNVSLSVNASRAALGRFLEVFGGLCAVLGLVARTEEDRLSAEESEEISRMLDARAAARKARQWQESDRLRDELKARGYVVEDTPQGQKLKPVG
jgi:cysteinyl-tRNA synthetase